MGEEQQYVELWMIIRLWQVKTFEVSKVLCYSMVQKNKKKVSLFVLNFISKLLLINEWHQRTIYKRKFVRAYICKILNQLMMSAIVIMFLLNVI